MFMRCVIQDFTIDLTNTNNPNNTNNTNKLSQIKIKIKQNKIKFKTNDIIMMSNGNSDTIFGGSGRKCPSRVWSQKFMKNILNLILSKYDIIYTGSNPSCDQSMSNKSWFWNKLSTKNVKLIPH